MITNTIQLTATLFSFSFSSFLPVESEGGIDEIAAHLENLAARQKDESFIPNNVIYFSIP